MPWLVLVITLLIVVAAGGYNRKESVGLGRARRLPKKRGALHRKRSGGSSEGSSGGNSGNDWAYDDDLNSGSGGGGGDDDSYGDSSESSGVFIYEVELGEACETELYSPEEAICSQDRRMLITSELNYRDWEAWEDLALGLCHDYMDSGVNKEEVRQNTTEFEIKRIQWYINKIGFDVESNQSYVANTTTIDSWTVEMRVFLSNTSNVVSAEASNKLKYEGLSLQEAVLFTIANQPNNAGSGEMGVDFYDPTMETTLQSLDEDTKKLFHKCSLPNFSFWSGESQESDAADQVATFQLTSFTSSDTVQGYLDRMVMSLLYRGSGRRLSGGATNVGNLFTITSQLSATLYNNAWRNAGGDDDLVMKTAVVCADQNCDSTDSGWPSYAPTMAPTNAAYIQGQPTSVPTAYPTRTNNSNSFAEGPMDVAAECGVVCDSLVHSSSLWRIYEARYGDDAADKEANSAGPLSTRASIYTGNVEVKASAYLVWLCLLFAAWIGVLIMWIVKMCAGFGKCGEVWRLKVFNFASYTPTSIYYFARNVTVTCLGGGVYAPSEHSSDSAPEREHGYGLSMPVLRFCQSGVVLVIILTRVAYIALLALGTLSRHLPSFVCMELAPYGLRNSNVQWAFPLSSMVSPVVLITATAFFPLFLVGMTLRRAMVLQLMRILNLGFLAPAHPRPRARSVPSSEEEAEAEEEEEHDSIRSVEYPLLFRIAFFQAFVIGIGGFTVLSTVLTLSLLPDTTESWPSDRVQPICLTIIFASAASAAALQLVMSPCFTPNMTSLLTARLEKENLTRRSILLSTLSSLYVEEDRRQNADSSTSGSAAGRVNSRIPAAIRYAGATDDSGHSAISWKGEREGGAGAGAGAGAGRVEPDVEMEILSVSRGLYGGMHFTGDGAPAYRGVYGGTRLVRSSPQYSISTLIDDSLVGITFTVISLVAVIAAATVNYVWGSILIYSGALRVLEVISTALLLRELYIVRNPFRAKLLKSIRER